MTAGIDFGLTLLAELRGADAAKQLIEKDKVDLITHNASEGGYPYNVWIGANAPLNERHGYYDSASLDPSKITISLNTDALGIFATRMRTWQLALTALLICFAVEFGQLVQTPWLVALRAHPLGHLVLGSTFGWGDLIAYTAGVAIAALVDKAALFRRR